MILLTELSRRRIRSINKLIRVGRNEVVVVVRVDRDKGKRDSEDRLARHLLRRRLHRSVQTSCLSGRHQQMRREIYSWQNSQSRTLSERERMSFFSRSAAFFVIPRKSWVSRPTRNSKNCTTKQLGFSMRSSSEWALPMTSSLDLSSRKCSSPREHLEPFLFAQ